LGPTGLSSIEYFCRSKVLKILVVGENLHLMECTFTVSSPVLKSVNDGEKFFIVDIVIDFRGGELA